VKAGAEIMVSVRHAISGADLGQLRDAVEREYLTLDQQERDVRAAMARMEASLMHGLMEFDHGR
jgi:F-type H+-transporting ATPase subunit epsilon